MKPIFSVLQRNYSNTYAVKQPQLFAELGWGDLVGKQAWMDTCAIRMSLALVKSGVSIPGRMAIKAGPYKGKRIEPGQANLSRILAGGAFLGKPDRYKRSSTDLGTAIGKRSGIVSFFNIDSSAGDPRQGHIDLVSPLRGYAECESFCYWESEEVWFWPLA